MIICNLGSWLTDAVAVPSNAMPAQLIKLGGALRRTRLAVRPPAEGLLHHHRAAAAVGDGHLDPWLVGAATQVAAKETEATPTLWRIVKKEHKFNE